MKNAIWFIILFAGVGLPWCTVGAATSSGSGNWSDASTWGGGPVPGVGEPATIQAGHTVTLNTASANARGLTLRGTLVFPRGMSTTLTLTGGDLNVESGGTLDMGTAASPIPASVKSTLVLALGSFPSQYGLIVSDGGVLTARGAAKSAGGVALSVAATNVSLPAAATAGWAVGDEILIGQTERAAADQTERRTITSLSGAGPVTVSWTGALAHTHDAAKGVHVVNLTRNVLIRSAGTNVNTNTAHMTSLTMNAADFSLVNAELAYIGGDAVNQWGVTVINPARATVSSCAVREGYLGLFISGGAGHAVSGNVFYRNEASGVNLTNGASGSFTSNYFISNGESGVVVDNGASGVTFSANTAFSNVDQGANFSVVTNAAILQNAFFAGRGGGLYVNDASDVLISSNVFTRNAGRGLSVEYTSDVAITSATSAFNGEGMSFYDVEDVLLSSATVADNGGDGITFFGAASVLAGLTVIRNGGTGIYMQDGGNVLAGNTVTGNATGFRMGNSGSPNLMLGNVAVSNVNEGVVMGGTAADLYVDDRFGYTAAGVAAPNSSDVFANGPANATFRGCRVRNSPGGFNTGSASLLSLGHNGAAGTAQILGHLRLTGALTLDNAAVLYASTASVPVTARGNGHTASIVSTNDANAVTQAVVVRFDGGSWRVEGSSSGLMDTLPGGAAASVTNRPVPAVNPQFHLTFQAGPSPRAEDRVAFGLGASSRDAGTVKRLSFGDPAQFGTAVSQLTVLPTGALTLRGAPGTPVVMDREAGSSKFHAFVSSGALTLENAAVYNTDASGLQLFGTGAVAISSTAFDFIGPGSGVLSYITARDVSGTATFGPVSFGVSRSTAGASAAYNVRVQGTDSSLAWAFGLGWSGAMAGPNREFDPNMRVRWMDAVAPAAAANFTATATGNYGEIRLTWTSAGNDGAAGALLPGNYLIFHSTDAAAAAAATPAQAQITIATATAAGVAQSRLVTGLALSQTHHFRLWTRDETPNTSAVSNAASALETHPAPQAPGSLAATPGLGQVTLTWSAPAAPPPAFLRHYAVSRSSVAASGPFVQITTVSASPYADTGLANETTYYYRVTAVDTGGAVSPFAAASARTFDVLPPEDVATLFAAPGNATGEVRLSWFAPGDNLGARNLPAGSRYRVQYALSSGVAWSTTSAQVQVATGPVTRGQAQAVTITGLSPSSDYYFRLWTADAGSLWSNPSNIVSARPRLSSPQVVSFAPSQTVGAPTAMSFPVTFNQAMDPASVQAGVTLRRIKNNLGEPVDEPVAPGWSAAPGNASFTVTAALQGNSVYEVRVSTTVLDQQGNPVLQVSTATFITVMDRAVRNVVTEGTQGVAVDIPPLALAADGYLAGDAVPPAQVEDATRKLSRNTGDPLRAPLSGAVVDLKAYDALGVLQSGRFASPVLVSFPYVDNNDDGVVDDPAFPRARARTLAVYWLDEDHGLWVRLASSVDTQNKRVTARAPHFTVFALMPSADLDLSQAHPFPSPYTGQGVITFTGLSQVAEVRIYTVAGELVRTLRTDDGSGQLTWDVKNESGEDVAAGIYSYRISNSGDAVKGRLAVVR